MEIRGGQPYPNYTFNDDNFAATASTQILWTASLHPKVGVVLPNDWLLYVTAGPAIAKVNVEHTLTDTLSDSHQTRLNKIRMGYVVGAGVAIPLSENLALEAKYVYNDFGSITSRTWTDVDGAGYKQSNSLHTKMWMVGLSYNFNESVTPHWNLSPASDFMLEAGFKVGTGYGTYGAPQPLFNSPSVPIRHVLSSRLTWDELESNYGETFLRLNHVNHFFGKLSFQSGRVKSGHMYDEDFPAPGGGYSMTQTDIDGLRNSFELLGGYNLMETGGSRLGIFVGHERRNYSFRTAGLCQLAAATPCTGYADDYDYVSRESRLRMWKIGVDTRLKLSERIWIDANAAYIPKVKFDGEDDHLARQFIVKDEGHGTGTSVEASLNYSITNALSLGFGARYFSFRSKFGRATAIDLTPNGRPSQLEASYTDDQLDLFLQMTYQIGGASASRKLDTFGTSNINSWTGLYVGGLMGAARLKDHWEDPFGNTLTPGGNVNYAGFGDDVTSAGAIMGVRVGYDQSFKKWIAGVSFTTLRSDVSGENTCFSGLRGLNCMRNLDHIYIAAARLGWGSNGTLVYGTAGSALVEGSLAINGRSFASYKGAKIDSKRQSKIGWLTGAGIEHRFDEHMSVYAEYNHIGGVHADNNLYDAAADIKKQPLSTNSALDIFILGVNYRF
ncbi:outer membrane protein [Herbaspirillum camelliae]|uniref:outer membrane protein n=1 Tax=Herbaspirillum camelliae TaxID=1892903 RepID=UPI000949D520|nr:outer membrane beta-barrel protein [Herbaspirillum camelliae]